MVWLVTGNPQISIAEDRRFVHCWQRPAIFSLKLTAPGYDALRDERLLRAKLPVMPTENEDAHTLVPLDALRQVITSCEQMLEQRGWKTALEELRKADNEYADEDWVNAVRDYYSALESGLKYALHEEGANYGDKNALAKLAARAAEAGLIPTNYQALVSFTDSIRSPRSPRSPRSQREQLGQNLRRQRLRRGLSQ